MDAKKAYIRFRVYIKIMHKGRQIMMNRNCLYSAPFALRLFRVRMTSEFRSDGNDTKMIRF